MEAALISKVIAVSTETPAYIYQALLPDVERLPIKLGDFQFRMYNSTLMVWERKTWDGLANDMLDSRLAEQIARMCREDTICGLLIEGWMTCDSQGYIRTNIGNRKVSWNQVMNFLQSVQQHLLLDFSPNMWFTAKRLLALRDYYQKPDHEALRRRPLPPPGLTPQQQLLCTLPGVDMTLAKRMTEQFTNLREFLSPDTVRTSVQGIGPLKNQGIEDFLTKSFKHEAP